MATSGTRVTRDDRARVLKLAAEKNLDGHWKLSKAEIARVTGLHPKTVDAILREEATAKKSQQKVG